MNKMGSDISTNSRFKSLLIQAWRFFKVFNQILYGIWKVHELPQPCVSIFGGTHISQESKYAKDAYYLSSKLVDAGISVLTGGGPGIMQAANCGAFKSPNAKAKTMGISVTELSRAEGGINPCAQDLSLTLDYFFARKWLLIHYSIGFVVFPGGIGTMDELSELMTLIQTNQRPMAPIVLIGVQYWDNFMKWIKTAEHEGFIPKGSIPEITLTDDLDFAVELLKIKCTVCD